MLQHCNFTKLEIKNHHHGASNFQQPSRCLYIVLCAKLVGGNFSHGHETSCHLPRKLRLHGRPMNMALGGRITHPSSSWNVTEARQIAEIELKTCIDELMCQSNHWAFTCIECLGIPYHEGENGGTCPGALFSYLRGYRKQVLH